MMKKLFKKQQQIREGLSDPRYGLIDHKGRPIVVKPEVIGRSKYGVLMIQDIIPLFDEFVEYLATLKTKGLVDPDSVIFEMRPSNLFISPDMVHHELLRKKITAIRSGFEKEFNSFESFLKLLALGAFATLDSAAISVLSSGQSSGLAAAFVSSDGKIISAEQIYSDKYFSLYRDAAKYFGFLLMAESPAVVVFNIRSDAMSIPLDRIFTNWYNRAIDTAAKSLFMDSMMMYTILREQNKLRTRIEYKNKKTLISLTEIEEPPEMSEENIKWVYVKVKLNPSEEEEEKILREIKSLSLVEATEYVDSHSRKLLLRSDPRTL